jgi:hypothetical protein
MFGQYIGIVALQLTNATFEIGQIGVNVQGQLSRFGKRVKTVRTFVHFDAVGCAEDMDLHVSVHGSRPGECLGAEWTGEWFFTGVGAHVSVEIAGLGELALA